MRSPWAHRDAESMNTPTHMLIGAAVFARPAAPATLLAAFAGGLVPDLPMLFLVLWSTRVAGFSEQQVFGELYFTDAWQSVFAVDHGFLFWGALYCVALWRAAPVLGAFAGAGLLHAAADFLTHNDDARRQFWPISDWMFRSPVSYWDARYYGEVFAVFELGLVAVLTGLLLWRMRRSWERALILANSGIMFVPVFLTGGLHGLHGMG